MNEFVFHPDESKILETCILISSFKYFWVIRIEKQIHSFVFLEKLWLDNFVSRLTDLLIYRLKLSCCFLGREAWVSFNFIAFLGFHKAQSCTYYPACRNHMFQLLLRTLGVVGWYWIMYLQRLDTKVPAGCTNMALKLLILHAYRTVL